MKPENQFISSVHKYLDRDVIDFEHMGTGYSNGTADMWYDGPNGDLWIEYKYIHHIPRGGLNLVTRKSGPKLSKLQKHWLRRRYKNGRYVWVIVGTSKGGIILRELRWERDIPADTPLLSRKEIAERITQHVTGAFPL